MIFILGTGRSGTHWVARILGNHSDIVVSEEEWPMFRLSTTMALDPRTKWFLMRPMILAYKWKTWRASPKDFADKSHPNLWHVEELISAFPTAQFLGIQRNPYATVASMLKHEGVKHWQDNWRQFPIPNAFLGITGDLAEAYSDLSAAERASLRWSAHYDRMRSVEAYLDGRFLLLEYERLLQQHEEEVARIWAFLNLDSPNEVHRELKAHSLDKWRQQLNPRQISQIEGITGVSVDDVPSSDA